MRDQIHHGRDALIAHVRSDGLHVGLVPRWIADIDDPLDPLGREVDDEHQPVVLFFVGVPGGARPPLIRADGVFASGRARREAVLVLREKSM